MSRLKGEYRNTVVIFLSSTVLLLLLITPWALLMHKLNLNIFSVEWMGLFSRGGSIFSKFDLSGAIGGFLGEFLYSIFDSIGVFFGSGYGAVWFILFILFFINIKKLFLRSGWIPFIFLLFGFGIVFISIGLIEDFKWSLDRYILHLFPLSYLWILSNLPLNHQTSVGDE